MKKILVTREKLGNYYPLSVSPIFLSNDSTGGLYVEYKKKKYNLNGMAKKGEALESIWSDSIIVPGTKKPLGILFDICKDRGLM